MKKIFAALGIVTFAVVGCDDSSSASSNDDPGVESSSSEAVFSSSSSEQFFVPSEYRTCDKKYEGKFLLHQYDLWYYNDKSHEEVEKIVDEFYKCEKGKWSGPLDSAPENETGGDVIRVAPDDWECDAENEGVVKPWKFYVCSGARIWGYTPARYARCEQGDWVLCEPESSSSSSVNDASSSSVKSSSSSSVILSASEESSSSLAESSSSVEESSSSEKTPESSSSSADVQSSSSETESSSSSSEDKVNCSELLEGETGWNWDIPKECRFNPNIDYGTMTDERDGKVYRTVKIGNQVWMAENLNYSDSSTTPSLKGKSWCYNREPKNCDVTGRLYTWAAAIDSVKLANDADNPLDCGSDKICGLSDTVQGICPPGWHLPSYAEWDTLVVALGGRFNVAVGTLLKSQSGWDKGSGNGTDAFGFCALPAGISDVNTGFAPSGEFKYGGNETNFWSSTEEDDEEESYSAVCMNLYTSDGGPFRELKNAGISVRCLKN